MFTDLRALAVALAAICAFLDLYATQALLPQLARDFAATPAEVSHTVSATTFAVALIAPFVGIMADRIGRKRVIVAAMFLLVWPTVMVALAASLGQMIFWRFVQGLLLPPIFAVTVAYIAEEWPPAEATMMTGIYTSATGFGGFLSRFLTALLAEHFGWRAAFLGLAALTLALALGVATLLPQERRFTRSSGLLAAIRFTAAHLANPRLLATYGVGFGVLFSFVAIFTYVDFVLAAPPFDLSTAALGSIFVVYLLGVAVTPLTGRLVARFGRRGLFALAIGAWIGGLALTLSGSLAAIVAGLAIGVVCGFLCQACATSYVAVTARHGRSSAVGLYVAFYYIGGSAGAVIPGLAWNAAGWPGCIAVVSVVLLLVAGGALRFWAASDRPTR